MELFAGIEQANVHDSASAHLELLLPVPRVPVLLLLKHVIWRWLL
jgi:hypothetical protein